MTYALGGQRAVRVALASLLLAASAACSPTSADRDNAGPTATVATEPPRTTTTNPYAVPTVIDIAYVNRVLAGLDAALGDVVRLVFRSKTMPPEAVDRLKSIYATPDVLQLYIDGLQIDMRAGFRSYRPEVGNRSSIATRIISALPDCIFAQVVRDYSAVSVDPSAVVNPQWVGLKRLHAVSEIDRVNAIPWAFVYDGFSSDRTQPFDPCVK